jgi:hypothetical protein
VEAVYHHTANLNTASEHHLQLLCRPGSTKTAAAILHPCTPASHISYAIKQQLTLKDSLLQSQPLPALT